MILAEGAFSILAFKDIMLAENGKKENGFSKLDRKSSFILSYFEIKEESTRHISSCVFSSKNEQTLRVTMARLVQFCNLPCSELHTCILGCVHIWESLSSKCGLSIKELFETLSFKYWISEPFLNQQFKPKLLQLRTTLMIESKT